MDPGVKAAWISSMVALAVAVIGVIATGIAQWWGTKTAHANALALFAAQAAEQNRIRAEEAVARNSTAFLADRRAVYAQFIRAMGRLKDAMDKYDKLTERQSALVAEPSDDRERLEEQVGELGATIPEKQTAHESRMAAHEEVGLTLDEILMLAPAEVADAARSWYITRKDDYNNGYGLFVNAARLDVGAQPLVRPPLRESSDSS
jgi:hypothetical protein